MSNDNEYEEFGDEVEYDLTKAMSTFLTPRSSMTNVDGGRRLSRASIKWFQEETEEHGLIGKDGKVRDEYIMKRQSVNRPATLKTIPVLADLTTEITNIDGWVLTHLWLCGFAKMNTKIDELNRINVFPIADGDTGANMKVCLKLPTRNLLLDPSDNILTVASNMAADVLLNGQGNSGTILAHFFVSIAEEIKACNKKELSINEFTKCLINTGIKMNDAVPNPVEGTLLSVCRDACQKLQDDGNNFDTLNDLLKAWVTISKEELAKTPEQLVVDGEKVLQKAGVVDSGAQGFVYMVEGMYLASLGELPEATDPTLFQTKTVASEDIGLRVDHTVTDSKYQFCTEAVVLLKDGIDQKEVIESVTDAADNKGLGDSIASVGAPAKEGGNMVKVHIHTNEPQQLFDLLQPFNRDDLLKKEKIEDMFSQREVAHGENLTDLGDAKFTIMGMCTYFLPPTENSDELYTLPVFIIPSSTQEPIDMRFTTSTDTCNALNLQRHTETAQRYTTAASNPMQIKIELLAALAKGKPLLIILMSVDKRISAIGRNVMSAIDLLTPQQKEQIKVFVHGWGFHEVLFQLEAIKYAKEGKTIDEAYIACTTLADRNFSFCGFCTSTSVRKLLAWRPGLFPKDFTVEDGQYISFGIPVTVYEGEQPLSGMQRVGMLMTVQNKELSLSALQDAEVNRIKTNLKPGEKIESLCVSCVGRVDYGYQFVEKLKAANIPLGDNIYIYLSGFFAVAASGWGEMAAFYKVVKE